MTDQFNGTSCFWADYAGNGGTLLPTQSKSPESPNTSITTAGPTITASLLQERGSGNIIRYHDWWQISVTVWFLYLQRTGVPRSTTAIPPLTTSTVATGFGLLLYLETAEHSYRQSEGPQLPSLACGTHPVATTTAGLRECRGTTPISAMRTTVSAAPISGTVVTDRPERRSLWAV